MTYAAYANVTSSGCHQLLKFVCALSKKTFEKKTFLLYK